MNYYTHKKCPLCSDTKSFLVSEKGNHFTQEKVVICEACGLVFLNPRMSDESLNEYYLSNQFSNEFRGSEKPDREADDYRDKRAQRRWHFLSRELSAGMACLEIGCSNGSFLKILRDNAISALGIDPSTGYCEAAKKKGLNVYPGVFPDTNPCKKESLDAVLLFQVIEHVADPRFVLKAIRELLVEEGILVLEYPDLGRALNRNSLSPNYFQSPHLYDYTQKTMSLLLMQCGFSIRSVYYETERPLDKNVLIVAEKCEANKFKVNVAGDADALKLKLRNKLIVKKKKRKFLSLFKSD